MNNDSLVPFKNALSTMLTQYLIALEENGIKDVKQQIATDVAICVDLEKEQKEFIEKYDSLRLNIQDLSTVLDCGKIDDNSKIIITAVLERLRKIK